VAAVFRHPHWILLLVLLSGSILRLTGLTFQSLWLDELDSVTWSAPALSVSTIIDHYQVDPHPPLYPLLLHYWMVVFGYTELAARSLSALIGCLSIVAVYSLGKECLDRRTGLIASLIVSFNYFALYYSQEVRSYILLFTLTTWSFAFFIKALRSRRRRDVASYAVVTTLLLYSHYYGLIALLTQAIYLLYHLVIEARDSRAQVFTRFGSAGVLIAILYSPWIPTTFEMMKMDRHWTKKPDPDFFVTLFQSFFGNDPILVPLFAVLIFCPVIYQLSRSKRGGGSSDDGRQLKTSIKVLVCWAVFSLLIPYVRSILVVPMYHRTYVIGTLAALIVLASMGISLIRRGMFRAVLVTVIFVTSTASIFLHQEYFSRQTKEDWRGLTRFVIAENEERFGDTPIRVFTSFEVLLSFYFYTLDREVEIRDPSTAQLDDMLSTVPTTADSGIGVWLLQAHGHAPGRSFVDRLKGNFHQTELKRIKKGSARLFELSSDAIVVPSHPGDEPITPQSRFSN